MKSDRRYYVYLLSNRTRRLYVGVTNDLQRRVYEHKKRSIEGFTKKYYLNYLVFFEETTDVSSAIAREKQIKSWRRAKKIDLIESSNPKWIDLAQHWYV